MKLTRRWSMCVIASRCLHLRIVLGQMHGHTESSSNCCSLYCYELQLPPPHDIGNRIIACSLGAHHRSSNGSSIGGSCGFSIGICSSGAAASAAELAVEAVAAAEAAPALSAATAWCAKLASPSCGSGHAGRGLVSCTYLAVPIWGPPNRSRDNILTFA